MIVATIISNIDNSDEMVKTASVHSSLKVDVTGARNVQSVYSSVESTIKSEKKTDDLTSILLL